MPLEYTPDEEAQSEKQAELFGEFCRVSEDQSVSTTNVFKVFCKLSPPMKPPAVAYMLTLHDFGRQGGETRKPGNIILNWKHLVAESGDVVLGVAGAATSKWLIPFAALSLWNKVWAYSKIEITKEQAVTLFVLWRTCDSRQFVNINDAYTSTQAQFIGYGWPSPSLILFNQILNDLEALKCIRKQNHSLIWLCEWVRKPY